MEGLIIMLGVSGSGKSTFIKEMGWEQYTINPDLLRIMAAGYEDGHISAEADRLVWVTAYKMLDWRLWHNKTAVFDATNVNPKTMTTLIKYANWHHMPYAVVDTMQDCDLETAKCRNAERPEYMQVPEEVIDRQYASYLKVIQTMNCKFHSRQSARRLGKEGLLMN